MRLSLSSAERVFAVKVLKLLDVHPRVCFSDFREKREYFRIGYRIVSILCEEAAAILIDESNSSAVRYWPDGIAAIPDHLKSERRR